jgi:hypothetical protein
VVIDDEMAGNLSRYGVSLHALGEEFASLTGQANPFPGTDPAPEPPVPSDHSAEDVAAAVRSVLTDLGL